MKIKIVFEIIWALHWVLKSFWIIDGRPKKLFSHVNISESIMWFVVVVSWALVTILAVAFWHPLVLTSFLFQYSKIIYLCCLPAFGYEVFAYYKFGMNDKEIIKDDVRLTAVQNRTKRYFATFMPIIEYLPTFILAGFAVFK